MTYSHNIGIIIRVWDPNNVLGISMYSQKSGNTYVFGILSINNQEKCQTKSPKSSKIHKNDGKP